MKNLWSIIAILIAALYFFMGYKALSDPANILAIFDVQVTPEAMQNEVSAVYGGFGIAFGLVLLIAHFRDGAMAAGAILSLGVLTLGMAAGRVVALCFLQPANRYPYVFMGMEVLMGLLLVGMALYRSREWSLDP